MAPTVRDRTDEFLETCKVYKMSNNSNKIINNNDTTNNNGSLSQKIIDTSAKIHENANDITLQMNESKIKIKQLLQLSRTTSNFRDNRAKIHELMADLKGEIQTSIKNQIHALEIETQNLFKHKKDNCSEHHMTLIDVIKLRHTNLVKSLINAMQITTQCLSKQKRERDQLGSIRAKPRRARNRYGGIVKGRQHPSLQRMRNRRRKQQNSDEEMHLLNDDGNFNSNNAMYAQDTQMQQIDRAEDALKIEQELREIGSMLSQLGELVAEQEHTILNINTNIEDANDQMEDGIAQLQKYLARLSGNRWLMIKIFAILIFFAILFMLIG